MRETKNNSTKVISLKIVSGHEFKVKRGTLCPVAEVRNIIQTGLLNARRKKEEKTV